MTNKKAIEILKEEIEGLPEDNPFYEAVDLAIGALEDWDGLKLICANEGIVVYKIKENKE